MTIHEKLSLIQTQFKSKKSRFNKFGNYNFRSAEDILESLKPFNDKHKVYFIIDEEQISEGVIKSTAYIRDGKDEIDDIDHLSNRRVRTVGEQLLSNLEWD